MNNAKLLIIWQKSIRRHLKSNEDIPSLVELAEIKIRKINSLKEKLTFIATLLSEFHQEKTFISYHLYYLLDEVYFLDTPDKPDYHNYEQLEDQLCKTIKHLEELLLHAITKYVD